MGNDEKNALQMTKAAETALQAMGAALREQREYRGEDIYEIADYLRIRPSYLMGLEDGDLQSIPARPYAFGFLRTYGSYLGFDGEELVRRLKTALSEPDMAAAPTRAIRQPEQARPHAAAQSSLTLVTASVMLLVGVSGGWWVYSKGDDAVEAITAIPAQIGREVAAFIAAEPPIAEPTGATGAAGGARVTGDASRETTTAMTGVEPSGAPSEPLAGGSVGAGELEPLEAPGTGAPASSRRAVAALEVLEAREQPLEQLLAPARQTAGAQGAALAARDGGAGRSALLGPADVGAGLEALSPTERGAAAAASIPSPPPVENGRLVINAREESWIQVRSRDGVFVRTRTLDAGERLFLPDRDDLALWTGNAGGIEIILEGNNLGSLGASGEVMRDVSLEPATLRSRTQR